MSIQDGEDGLFNDYEPEFCECDGEECYCGLESSDEYDTRLFHEMIIEPDKNKGLEAREALRQYYSPSKELAQCLAMKMIAEDDDALAIVIKNISKEKGITVEEVTQRMFF